MAKTNRATQAKRRREINKQDKRKEKEERRVRRKEEKGLLVDGAQFSDDFDPDLVGIYPGPQPQESME